MSKKCPKCDKAVYMAEEQIAAGKSWHKTCFTCSVCNKRLDSTTLAEKNDVLYCKTCHGKNFGPKGYGYGQGAGVLSMDTPKSAPTEVKENPTGTNTYSVASRGIETAGATAPSTAKFGGGDKCPRCGKTVYLAEKVVGAGCSWHKTCFTCKDCNKGLDSTSLADKDGEIFCKACHAKRFGPKGYGYGQGAGTLAYTQ
eukprot:Opistho-1_new@86660